MWDTPCLWRALPLRACIHSVRHTTSGAHALGDTLHLPGWHCTIETFYRPDRTIPLHSPGLHLCVYRPVPSSTAVAVAALGYSSWHLGASSSNGRSVPDESGCWQEDHSLAASSLSAALMVVSVPADRLGTGGGGRFGSTVFPRSISTS